jgi:hypothetical protein
MNFHTQPVATFVFFVFSQKFLLKVVHPPKVYQHIKFRGLTVTGASFASTSKV